MDDLVTWLRAQLDIDEEITQDVAVTQDPDRWRAEIDAKRRIIDWCEVAHRSLDAAEVYGVEPRDVLGLLALPYADREGYRDEWRP